MKLQLAWSVAPIAVLTTWCLAKVCCQCQTSGSVVLELGESRLGVSQRTCRAVQGHPGGMYTRKSGSQSPRPPTAWGLLNSLSPLWPAALVVKTAPSAKEEAAVKCPHVMYA